MIRDKYDDDDDEEEEEEEEDDDHYRNPHDVIVERDERSFNDNKGDVTRSYIQWQPVYWSSCNG